MAYDQMTADLLRENQRLEERERHFATVLGVTDGGRYRNDWDAAIQRVLDERACYREALVAIETDTDDRHLRNYIRTVLDT